MDSYVTSLSANYKDSVMLTVSIDPLPKGD